VGPVNQVQSLLVSWSCKQFVQRLRISPRGCGRRIHIKGLSLDHEQKGLSLDHEQSGSNASGIGLDEAAAVTLFPHGRQLDTGHYDHRTLFSYRLNIQAPP
jgi:hypothetical protein